MRRFRFVGNPGHYYRWDSPPVYNKIYNREEYCGIRGGADAGHVFDTVVSSLSDWEEVFEEPQIFNRVTEHRTWCAMKYFNMIMSIICIVLATNNHFVGDGEHVSSYVVISMIFTAYYKIDKLGEKVKENGREEKI